ncbi:MAG TPA: CapA family protein [Thermoanaerobaculales bacterium]|nr:CapA family protein [Thermoanaerobaculales bacterium]HPA82683.1 CapA family protein [Thermoanaerobaculales bacterium]HQL31034.1 CapA family protein [Thermoanaerobaculales bacterium]HQN95476.1 CapA family protein [Thermoanaerobaculales bacterium]HQP42195.1 CapA family protein [Thermoanaerobaculales bacterium]
MSMEHQLAWQRVIAAVVIGVAGIAPLALAQSPAPAPLAFDQSRSVYNRILKGPEKPDGVDWEARVSALLREQPGDIIVTAVGDMIFNSQISTLPAPHHRQLLRLMQEADIAYGNLEFSINDRPDLQRVFYNFRTPTEFVWELAAIGINLVSMANNHALDFGPEGLQDCLKALDRASIGHAGAGLTLAEARAPETERVQSQTTRFALLSTMRYWTSRYRCSDANGPCLATIDPAEILVAAADGGTETVEGPLADDVAAMEDDVVLARRHHDVVMVSLHNHDRSHHRAYGIQDTTPPNDEIMYRRAIDAGADMVLGSGPHVLRGIEIYKGKPIFYSLSNFIYQYRTPEAIPVDLIHQRDGEVARPANVSVWDRRDPEEIFQGVMVRMTINASKLTRVELIPFTIDDEGPLYGVPRMASAERGRAIIELLGRLSEPYGTRIVDKGWYAEVALEP